MTLKSMCGQLQTYCLPVGALDTQAHSAACVGLLCFVVSDSTGLNRTQKLFFYLLSHVPSMNN
jgi:hypothetical protein